MGKKELWSSLGRREQKQVCEASLVLFQGSGVGFLLSTCIVKSYNKSTLVSACCCVS